MPRIGSIIERVQIDLQRAVDEIEARNDERPESEPALRVADVEVEVPFGVEDDESNGDGSDELNVVPGGTGGSFRLQLTPSGTVPTRNDEGDEAGNEPPSPIPGLDWNALGTRLDPSVVDALRRAVGEETDAGEEEGAYDHPILLPERGAGGGTPGDGAADDDSEANHAAADRFDDWPVHHVKGIGPQYQKRLAEHGVERIADLASADPERLAERTGLAPSRVRQFVRRAQLMALGANEDDAAVVAALGVEPADLAGTSVDDLVRIIDERDLSVRLPDGYETDTERLRRVAERAREEA